MTVTVGEERRAQLRAAYTLTHLQEGHRTFSEFIASALDAEIQRLESKYNQGQRFETAEQGVTRGGPWEAEPDSFGCSFTALGEIR